MDELKPLEHKIKAAAFALARPMLKRPQREFQPMDGSKLSRVLFLRPEKIGDMVISFPVFDGLKRSFPHIQISILASPRNQAIIERDTRFEHVFLYRKHLWKDIQEVRAIRKMKFDCVVDMICDDSVTALFLSQLCAPGKPRIGVGKVKYREFYDFNYDHRMGNTGHIIDNTLKLLEAFAIDSGSVSCYAPPFVAAEKMTKMVQFAADLRGGKGTLLVGYNLSAGSPTRLWASEKSEELVRRLLADREDLHVVIFTTPAERSRGDALMSKFVSRVSQVPAGMSLQEASALISQLDLLITPDTAPVHIARSFKVPVVGMYSRFMKNFLLWKPFGQEVGAVVSGNDDNIHDITVDQVFEAYRQVLAQRKAVAR